MATQKTWEAFASTVLLNFVLLKSFCFSPCWSLKKKNLKLLHTFKNIQREHRKTATSVTIENSNP